MPNVEASSFKQGPAPFASSSPPMAFSFSTPAAGAGKAPFSFNSPAPATPFSFASPAPAAPLTNLFGQPNNNNAAPAGGLFGGQNTSTQAPSAGLFGTSTAAAAPTTGLFGATSQPASSGGLFGSAPAPQTGGLFGSQPQQSNLFGSSGGLFGQTSQQPASTGLFGTSSQPQPQTQSGGLFGQTQTKPATSNLFGASSTQPATNLFGSTQPQPSNMFGQPQQNQFQTMQNTMSLAQSVIGLNASQNPQAQQPEESIDQRIMKIKNSYDPSNLRENAFQAYVYNVMDQQRAQYVAQHGGVHPRTAQDTPNDALWLKATRDNPDPKRYYPQLVVGHDALKKRVAHQEDFAQKHKVKLDEIATQVQQLSSVQTLQTSTRLQKAAHNQAVLSARLIRMVARIHALTPLRSTPVTAAEEELKSKIEGLAAQFAGSTVKNDVEFENHPNRMASKVNELWVAVAQLKAKRAYGSNEERDQEWTVANAEELGRVSEVLMQQQRTLDYLGGLLKKDEAVLDVIKAGFNEPSVAKSSEKR